MYVEERAIRLCQQGDKDEFRVIIDLHNSRLFKRALYTTHNPALAEEAVQETFIRAWKRIRSFKPGSNIGAWLSRILVNYLIDEHRKRRVETAPLEAAIGLSDGSGSAESAVILDDELKQLLRLIAELQIDQRIPVVMRYSEGFSLAQIAETTGWKLGTVKSRLNRAMKQLNKQFQAASEPIASSKQWVGRKS